MGNCIYRVYKMVMCWAPDCKHYNEREKCKFFRFPKDDKENKKWKNLLRRDVEPGPGAFVCSCHFRDGKKENGPELFLFNISKKFTWTSPEKKTRKRMYPLKIVPLVDMPSTSSDIEVEEIQSNVDVRDLPGTSHSTPKEIEAPSATKRGRQTHPQHSATAESSSAMLEAENYLLKKEIENLKVVLEKLTLRFSFNHIKDNDELILFYTGLPNAKIFIALFNLIKDIEINYYFNWKVEKIEKIDQLFMCLMKLRQNFPHVDIAQRFAVSQAAVSNIVITWIHVLHAVLYKHLMKRIPSRNANKTCLPTCFSTFTNCRIILDCTEMSTVSSRSSMKTQRMTYSSYKHNNTWKALVGVAPNGVVTFISGLYPGSTSDKKIVEDSDILKLLEPGDLILADKGFILKDILPPGIHVNIPPFLTTPQFTPEQVQQTESIARARIHVERAIQRIKCYKILKFLPQQFIQHGNSIIQVIGALTNLQYPLIKEVEKYYQLDE